MRLILSILLIAVLTGCDAVSLSSPDQVAIRTDDTSYILEHLSYGNRLVMRIEIENQNEDDVYLRRLCDGGEEPFRRFQRVPDSEVPVALDIGHVCGWYESQEEPIRIAGGSTYVDELELLSDFVTEGAYTNRESKTGAFQLSYELLSARRVGRETIYSPLVENVSSNVFEVRMTP